MSSGGLRVDHVSIAVRSIDRALDFFLGHFPARLNQPKQPGYGEVPEFYWADFMIGDFKIELIESAREGSFVERFLAARGGRRPDRRSLRRWRRPRDGVHPSALGVRNTDPVLAGGGRARARGAELGRDRPQGRRPLAGRPSLAR